MNLRKYSTKNILKRKQREEKKKKKAHPNWPISYIDLCCFHIINITRNVFFFTKILFLFCGQAFLGYIANHSSAEICQLHFHIRKQNHNFYYNKSWGRENLKCKTFYMYFLYLFPFWLQWKICIKNFDLILGLKEKVRDI